jgi:rare lipoprotein A
MKKFMQGLIVVGALLCHPADAFAIVRHGIQDKVARRPKKGDTVKIGRVSWYGSKFAGHKMANGDRFDPTQMMTASKTYPLGTRLELYCFRTNKRVFVTVTDRGPFTPGLDLDISEAAALALGIRNRGIAVVQITPIT